MNSLADAAAYLEGLINHERRPGFSYARLDLEPIRALLDRLGNPQDRLSVIHVAGSKGKGSTCLFAEAILGQLGERVGTFTSPHLESWVERFRVGGRPVEAVRLVEAIRRLRPLVDEACAGPAERRPSFFDATTAAAFLLFETAGVDRALIEVGLGGRLDSTNVVSPAVTCITSIELEHTAILGETEGEIAREKAGILKPGIPVVSGLLRPEAARVIRARAAEVGAPLITWGGSFHVDRIGGPRPGRNGFVFRQAANDGRPGFEVAAELAVPGRAAVGNAALAIACVRALGVHSDAALREAIPAALADCRLPGRIETLEHDPRVIVDAAHTAESARALAEALTTLAPDGVDLLLSVSSDKNRDLVLGALLPCARRVWVTRAEPIRSMPADALARHVSRLDPTRRVEVVEDAEEAVERARGGLEEGRRLCVTGSIYLAGIARRVLRPG
ncbi:MAG TPA: bifunctional folylpolyglutamate synthase/dihydrofolate synthase [Deltaproteobacteria bacterium]|nr:bifunctional folylpolyglutamate synthase/dihydrofolate synthase [Deltaproteobacteria bacterium]